MKMPTRADRWRRTFGFDANDMRRDVDRTQWRFGLFLLALFLVVTPPLSVHTAQAVHDSGKRNERHESDVWHRVYATVVKAEQLRGGRQVTVTWTEPDGTRRTGDLTTWSRVRAGDRVRAWVGPGRVSFMPPNSHTQTVLNTVAAGTGVVLATGLPLFGLYGLVRRRCDRRRDRLWDAAWARLDNHRIGP
ncbi:MULTISPECIES: hypothetical protein [unclassified Spirillospora]|uniref:Rv1733c family protein n=1 Tax=unclassified Spirillospora TaxID=2642701 RepID=UPI0037240C7C